VDGDAHYTERLVRLPGLGIDYQAVPIAAGRVTRESLGLTAGTLFFCGQALFKYLPAYDRLLARIAALVPDARFVFVDAPRGRQVKGLMQARLAETFDAARHCVFLERMEQADFAALSGLCDVVLDSVGWSGCNSTLECLPLGTPIVTLPGETMRGRHTAAILEEIGETLGVARDEEDYVRLAVLLAGNGELRNRVRAGLAANWVRATGDARAVRALEGFFASWFGGSERATTKC
jgi:predicted O-linked N-acetylglucosamine transferase (SPINDLY family)